MRVRERMMMSSDGMSRRVPVKTGYEGLDGSGD